MSEHDSYLSPSKYRKILVRCTIRPGGFSGECVFVLSTGCIGGGSALYFLGDDKKSSPLLAKGQETTGYVHGLQIGKPELQSFIAERYKTSRCRAIRAELPDGQVYMVPVADVLVELQREPEWIAIEDNEGVDHEQHHT